MIAFNRRDWMLAVTVLLMMLGSQHASAQEYCEGRMKEYEVRGGAWLVSSNAQLRKALCDAAQREGEPVVVYVHDNAEIDLSGEHDIPLYADLTLKSGRYGLNAGALLYTNSLSYEENREEFFTVKGDNVVVEGLRFRGPSDSKERRDRHINAIEIRGHRNIRIEGNEFFNWTGSGLFIECYYTDPDNRCAKDVPQQDRRSELNKGNASSIRITRNYFHHNRTQGRGYGVTLHRGAYALIEKNTFKDNRHAIASGGESRTGYIATLNFVYPEGTRYCKTTLGVEGCWYEHHFDMHGTGDDGNGNEGGIGGEYVEISKNTFHGEQRYGPPLVKKTRAVFDLRGEPQDGVLFVNNVLSHDSRDEAVRESWRVTNCMIQGATGPYNDPRCEKVVKFEENRFGALSDRISNWPITGLAEDGILDFDGDGVRDSFFPTGAAWYYSSGQRTEWRYLNNSAVKLDGIRWLRKFDGNKKTDVLRIVNDKLLMSRDGVGPWEETSSSDTPDTVPIGEGCTTENLGDQCGGMEGARCHVSTAGRPVCARQLGPVRICQGTCQQGDVCIRSPAPALYGRCMREVPTWITP